MHVLPRAMAAHPGLAYEEQIETKCIGIINIYFHFVSKPP